MAGIHVPAPAREQRPTAERAASVSPADAAWIAVVPCALLLIAAIALVGPWLGRTFMGPSGEYFWGALQSDVRPEPEEHGRYVVALLGPVLVCCAAVVLSRFPAARIAQLRPLGWLGQALAVAFVVLCVVAQRQITFGEQYNAGLPFERVYFTLPTLAVALAVAAAVAAALRSDAVVDRLSALLRETRARATVAAMIAIGATTAWLLTALVLESSAANTSESVIVNVLWSMNEPYAVLNGTGPLTGFHSQYGHLWPYLVAAPMALFGPSVDVYTVTMACIDAVALGAVFAILRRVTGSSLSALLLYLPFLATTFFVKRGTLDDRYATSNLFSVWPVRYAGPFLLAWLVARHIDRLAPRRRLLVLVPAGLVLLNNPEFGLGAFAATIAALLATGEHSLRAVARLAAAAALGVVGAAALVALLTLTVVGELPRFSLVLEFARVYGVEGWAMLPMPTLGIHLAFYVTFTAAIVVAIVRVLGGRRDVLTGMLIWAGTFGLIAGGYYAGRSHPEVLIDVFCAWAFALVLLVVVAVRDALGRTPRRATLPALAVLAGFGVAACSLAQLPTPWSQVERLAASSPERPLEQPEAVAFVAASAAPGEPVAILVQLSHRIAHDAGVVNVAPYSFIESMPTRAQLQRTIAALREAGGTRLFIPAAYTLPDFEETLREAGFEPVRTDQQGAYTEWDDRRG